MPDSSFMVMGFLKEDSKRYSVSGRNDSIVLACGWGNEGATSVARESDELKLRPGRDKPGMDMMGASMSVDNVLLRGVYYHVGKNYQHSRNVVCWKKFDVGRSLFNRRLSW